MFAVLLSPTLAWATFISSDDLFLAPSAIPFAVYDPLEVSPGGSLTFSTSDVPGATQLLGLHILPVLNPDPSTAQGNYTTSDLAGINVGNYSNYYAFQPNSDYFATTISSNASTATFDASGAYYVELQTSNGVSEKNTFLRVEADDFLGEDPAGGVKDATAADRKVTITPTDLTIISDGDPNDNGYLANAMKQFPNAVKATTVQQVIDAIKNYYNKNGKKKFEVTIIGHGRSGSIKIGTERINNDKDGTMTPADFQKAIDSYVGSVHFFSCNTGAGASGVAFLDALASSIKTVTAYDSYTTAADTYLDVGATGKLVTGSDVPEPVTWVMMLLGFGFTGAAVRHRNGRLSMI